MGNKCGAHTVYIKNKNSDKLLITTTSKSVKQLLLTGKFRGTVSLL